MIYPVIKVLERRYSSRCLRPASVLRFGNVTAMAFTGAVKQTSAFNQPVVQ